MDIQERIKEISEVGETWKPCPEFEEKYLISSHGRLLSIGWHNACKKEGFIKQHKKHGKDSYMQVRLYDNGRARTFETHVLVARAFLPNPNNYPMINHIDEDKTNNYVGNLEWCTNQYNVRYSNAKKVDVYTKDGKFVETLEAVSDIKSKYDVNTSNVIRCLKLPYGFCKGYQFRYHGKPFQKKPLSLKQKKRAERVRHDSNEGRYVTLYEYSINGTFIAEWPNSNAAARVYGIEGTNIRKCGRGEITTVGGKIFLRAGETIEERLQKVNNRKHKSKTEQREYA